MDILVNEEIERLKNKVNILETDKRLLYAQIQKLRKEKKELVKQLKEMTEKKAVLDEMMYLHQVTLFGEEVM